MRKIIFQRLSLFFTFVLPTGCNYASMQCALTCEVHAQSTAAVTPKLITFGNQAVGTTSSPSSITMSNSQSAAIPITSIQVAAPFAQTNNCGASLAPGQACTVSVSFSPKAVQYYSATMTITEDPASSPVSISLTGSGVTPVSYTPKTIPFPNQAVGTSSAPVVVTLTNNQSTALGIAGIQAPAPFAQANTCGTSIAAGQSCTVSVSFSPTAVQYYSSALTITTGAANTALTVALTGNGIVPVTYTPKTIPFPDQAVGTSSAPGIVTITNNQSTALSIGGVQVPAPFVQTNTCGSAIPAGQSCTVSVSFAPTSAKYYTANLTITEGPGNTALTVALSGNAVTAITYTPKNIAFANQAIGGTSTPIPVTISNNQSTPLSIASITTSAPFAQTNTCGTAVPAGKSCTVNVAFSPTAAKYYAANLTIIEGPSNTPLTVALGGNGIVPVTFTPKVGGLYFNNQIISTPSTPQAVTLTNNQPQPLTFTSIASTADYPFATSCGNGAGGGALAAGATCVIEISFDPQAIGKRPANMVISYDAPGGPITIPLQGSGIAGSPTATVRVAPPTPCILPSSSEQFYATVTDGSNNNAVTWYVDGKANGTSAAGTITADGIYTAPSSAGSHTIKAVSQHSTSLSGSAKITITSTPSFGIYPYVASIPTGGQQTFQAQMCTVPVSDHVTYTVDGITGGNSTVGTVSPTGVYTAPATAGKHTVRVTDTVSSQSSGGVVTVFSAITADFGSRNFTSYPVPADVFGTGRGEAIPTLAARELLTQGGLTTTRIYAQIPLVYATTTPNWSKIDPLISTIQAAGQHAILQLTQSPPWLVPTSGSCSGNSYSAPTDIAKWTQIAAAYVAHMDVTFPGVVQDYEIWNEPNATGICASDHMKTYMALYAAAAPAMKAQASQDGAAIRIGGPVLSGFSATWFSRLLTDPTTAPYVDFVSYHQYFFGATQLDVQWDAYNGNESMYEAMQDPSNGAFGVYKRVLQQTAAGKQPGGATTPVYVTEYNTNWSFYDDCCRNNPIYAPVFNAVYVTDMLNSVYNSSVQMPNKLIYFAGSAYPWFCMIGVIDPNMDCLYSAGATPVPYPQYYTYQLIAGRDYLGLAGGGYLAKNISTPTGGGGLATTAFYTPTQDAIVITNPTSTAYPQVKVTFSNPGFTSTQGTLYTVQDGAQINASSVSLASQGTSRTATISVPAYSVQAVSLK